jgi:ankyrin repeat protein
MSMDSLHNMARYGTARGVYAAIKKDPKQLNARNRHGETPLEIAIKAGNTGAANLLATLMKVK